MERKITPDVELFGLGANVAFWERAGKIGLIDEFEINQVAAGSDVFTVRLWLSSTQTAQENSPDALNGVLGGQVAGDAEKGSTGVFSGSMQEALKTAFRESAADAASKNQADEQERRSGPHRWALGLDPVHAGMWAMFAKLRDNPDIFHALAETLGYPQNKPTIDEQIIRDARALCARIDRAEG